MIEADTTQKKKTIARHALTGLALAAIIICIVILIIYMERESDALKVCIKSYEKYINDSCICPGAPKKEPINFNYSWPLKLGVLNGT